MVDQAQDTLRPNNRLSDMQATMEQTQAFENRVLERLNAGKTVRSFLITALVNKYPDADLTPQREFKIEPTY